MKETVKNATRRAQPRTLYETPSSTSGRRHPEGRGRGWDRRARSWTQPVVPQPSCSRQCAWSTTPQAQGQSSVGASSAQHTLQALTGAIRESALARDSRIGWR